MDMREFAQQLNGREYDYQMFSGSEIQTAKDNNWVIVTGASDDLMEFEGAIQDEGGCCGGGKVCFSKDSVYYGEGDKSKFPNIIKAFWLKRSEIDVSGRVITWTYETDIPHETFMVHDNGEPYCRGIVFSVDDLK